MKCIVISLLWLTAIAFAFSLDAAVAQRVRASGLEERMHAHALAIIRFVWKAPGVYGFTIVVALVVALFHPLRWRAGLLVLLAGAIAGLNYFTKWAAGRVRPYRLQDAAGQDLLAPFHLDPFVGGIRGAWNTPNLSFPSGHTALAFATAAAVSILWPKWRAALLAGAALVGVERVAENAHWLSDVVVAAALGILAASLVRWLWWDRASAALLAKHDG